MPPQISVERLAHSRILCTVHFEEQELSTAEEKALSRIGAAMDNIKGFRPGKAPPALVQERVKPEQLLEETIHVLIEQTLPPLLKENNLLPIIPPKVEVTSRTPLSLKITLIERPKVSVRDPDTLKIEKKNVQADPKHVEQLITSLLREHKTTTPKEGQAAKGDQVQIAFSAKDRAGSDIDGLRHSGYSLLLGESHLLPGFEDQIIGMKKGEERSFPLALPDRFAEEQLRGQTVTVTVRVDGLESVHLPELTDAFAKEKFSSNSAEGFRERVWHSVLEQEQRLQTSERHQRLLEEIRKRTEGTFAQELIDEEAKRLFWEWEEMAKESGQTIEEWLKQRDLKTENAVEELKKGAEQRLRLRYGINFLIEHKNVTVSEQEMQKAVSSFLAAVPEEQKKTAEGNLTPGTDAYEELRWRTRVEKLLAELLAAS